MADILEIGINLRDQLSRQLRDRLSAFRRFGQGVRRAMSRVSRSIFSIRTALIAAVTFFTARFVGRFVTGIAEIDDRFGKLSDRLGVTTETLSALRFAGEQSGIEFNNLATGLQRATRRLEEFRTTGRGSASDAIVTLGIDQLVRDGASLEALLPRIAEGFRGIQNQAERVRVAFQLFDTEGVALVQLLQQGAGGLEKFRDEAERLGIVVTREGVRKAEDFNDALNRLKNVFLGIRRAIVDVVLPPLTTFFDNLTEFILEARPEVESFFGDLKDALSFEGAKAGVTEFTAALKSLLPSLRDIFLAITTILRLVFEAVDKVSELISEGQRKSFGPFGVLGKGPRERTDIEIAAERAIVALEALEKRIRGFGESGAGDKAGESMRRLTEEIKKAEEELDRIRAGDPFSFGLPLDEPLRDRFTFSVEMNKRLKETNNELETQQGLLDGIGAAGDRLRDRLEVFSQARDTALSFASSLENNVGNAFTALITRSKGWKEAFKDMAKAILADIARLIARLIVLNTVVRGLEFLFSSAGRGGGGGGGTRPRSRAGVGGGVSTLGAIVGKPGGLSPAVIAGTAKSGPSQTIVQVTQNIQATDAESFQRLFKRGLVNAQTEVSQIVIKDLRANAKLRKQLRI